MSTATTEAAAASRFPGESVLTQGFGIQTRRCNVGLADVPVEEHRANPSGELRRRHSAGSEIPMPKIQRVAAVLGCLVLGLAISNHKPAETAHLPPVPADASEPVKSMTVALAFAQPAQVANVPPPPGLMKPLPVEETPYRLVLGLLDREAYPDVQVKGSTVRIRYRLGSVWSVAMGRSTFDSTVAQIVPAMFAAFPKISTINIAVEASTVDIRGNEGRASAAEVEFSRRNAGTIHWDVIDKGNVEQLADTAWYDHRFR